VKEKKEERKGGREERRHLTSKGNKGNCISLLKR
jgi:hypothetical protein